MNLTATDLVVFGAINLVMCIFSSMAGGGAGFVTMPVMLALGLSPAQAVATSKFTGLAATGASLHGLRSVKISSRRRLIGIMALALAVGIISPFFIKHLNSELYRIALGVLLLLMAPVIIWKRVGLHETRPSPLRRNIGYVVLTLALMLQAIFSGGLGTLVPITLMSLLGMHALEANVTKRYSQLLLNVAVVAGVLFSGLIIWKVAVVGIASAFIGSAVGSRIAVRKGNQFVMWVTVVLMLLSGLWLIFG
jgi:uncharacterized membrane protein YfcA